MDPTAEVFTASMVEEMASKLDFLSLEDALEDALKDALEDAEVAVVDKLEVDAEPERVTAG